jgi:hypothetical protein
VASVVVVVVVFFVWAPAGQDGATKASAKTTAQPTNTRRARIRSVTGRRSVLAPTQAW